MSKWFVRQKEQKPSSPVISSIASVRIEEARRDNLTKLDLSNHGLTELPESIGHLTQLQELDLHGNQLTGLPASMNRMVGLVRLNLAINKLKIMPEEISQLRKLSVLDLESNELTWLPEWIGQLTLLQFLYFSNNQLETLPDSIGYLTQLQTLNVRDNQIMSLPVSIGQLTQLQKLILAGNQLTRLPETIGNLTHLRELDLHGNQLTRLPETIGLLDKLTYLNLTSNKLKVLPKSSIKLVRLQTLYLHYNALELPEEVIGPTEQDIAQNPYSWRANPSQILSYYFRLREGGQRPLNEAKLILVGRGGVGKTSIVNRLVYDRFYERERQTQGINITEWRLKLKGTENVRLNIWDFGGQEIMHATHQFFLTQRSLYLLVLNGREGGEDADAEYWLKLIESFGGDSPVIIVMNKIRECSFDLNRRALKQKYPFISQFIKTDCWDKTGIKELREAIERETDSLDHLRDAFPENWFLIKDWLAGMKKNYLGFDEYCKLCEKHGEKDPAAQVELASHLHNLGIILNYRDDPRLQDTHVLNPHWVTNGIYKILNSNLLYKQKGEIRLNDVMRVVEGSLDAVEYPANMWRFIFDLMKKFDLCFAFPDDDTYYLIPELLDKQEPQDTAEFNSEECLTFQYHYPVLPEGLLPRFIVRTQILSEGLPRWRTGVILKFEANRAVVKADVQDKKVFISISGPISGRRRLLAIIRSDFERIHYNIRNLQPLEMVPVPGHPDLVVPYKKLQVMEQNAIEQFVEVMDNGVITLNVHELLNGVDLEGTRRIQGRSTDEQRQAVRLFISYSHKDEHLRKELEPHLKILQRRGLIKTWHDRNILAGDEWKKKIDENLERADIVLLLVSADFIASDYCYEKEMKRAMEREQNGEALVIPIIVRDVNWNNAPFAKHQALPKDGRAITKWADKNSGWRNVSEGIERVIMKMRKKQK